jgi:hypothetical protein
MSSTNSIAALGSSAGVVVPGDQIDTPSAEQRLLRATSQSQTAQVAQRTLEQTLVTQGDAQSSLASEHDIYSFIETEMTRELEETFRHESVPVVRGFFGSVEGRAVHAYHFGSSREVVNAVWHFVQNRYHSFVSPVGDEASFTEMMARKRFLVIQEWSQHVGNTSINHVALCLASFPRFRSTLSGSPKDIYFSGDDIKDPSQCSQGHIFEYDHLLAWHREQGTNICPVGIEHPLTLPGGDGNIHIDETIKREIAESKTHIPHVQETCRKVLAIVRGKNISVQERWLGGAVGAIGFGASGATIGALVLGVPGAVVGGAVGCAIGVVSGGWGLFSWLWNRVTEWVTQKALWENEAKSLLLEFLMRCFHEERPTRDSINANFRAMNDVSLPFIDNSEEITSKLHQLLNAARDEALTKI